jgi:uncharacterized protein
MNQKSREFVIRILRNEMPYLRNNYGVERICLFGSFARSEEHEDSDVDLLVSLSKPLGFSFVQLADYLEEKLGRQVDLVTTNTLERGSTDPRRAHIAREIRDSLINV